MTAYLPLIATMILALHLVHVGLTWKTYTSKSYLIRFLLPATATVLYAVSRSWIALIPALVLSILYLLRYREVYRDEHPQPTTPAPSTHE